MLIHIGTTVTTVFGVVDDSGNVVQQHPLQVQISALTPDQFAKALDTIAQAKLQLEAALPKSALPTDSRTKKRASK